MKSLNFIIRQAYESICSNKLRAFLTILGVIIGVGSVITIMALGATAQNIITKNIKDIGTNVLTIMPGKTEEKGPPVSAYGIVITTLKYEDAKAIKTLPHINYVGAYISGTGTIAYKNRSLDTNYLGASLDYQNIENQFVINGRFFTQAEENTNANVAVIGDDIKTELFPLTNPIGEKIKIKNESFKVIGVLERKGSSVVRNPDKQVIIPITTAQKKLLGLNHLGLIRIKIDDEKNVDIAINSIEKLLRNRHNIVDPKDDDFSIHSVSQALETFTAVTNGIRFFLALIAAVSLLVGGIGIMNIMLITVKERTREIGLRKAIGAAPNQIKNQFLLETLVLTITGGILGIILGVLLTIITSLIVKHLGYSWDFIVPISSIILAFFISSVIGIIFGYYPSKQAAKLNPIEALRYE